MEKNMTNCPNCGGAITHAYNYNCEYCGTFLHLIDRKVQEIKNAEIRNVEVTLIKSPIDLNHILQIKGTSIPKTYTYEENKKYNYNNHIFSIEDVKPIGYAIEIPYELIYECRYKQNINILLDWILYRLPPLFKENYLIEQKIIECIVDLVHY